MGRLNTAQHPCFNKSAKGSCGRVHLPVARECNIRCNYCNRKYDCVNESRPGVSSSVLNPAQAEIYLQEVLEQAPHITVAGIAGPGDAFATPRETVDTLKRIRERFPELLLCLATNGLNLPAHVKDLAELDVTHVTVTINSVDPQIGAKIYQWVRDGKVVYRGKKGAELLLQRQTEGVRLLKEHGITVKVNTIVIPGINDHHVMEVARYVKELGADLHNLMPMYPTAGTPFGSISEPTLDQMVALRAEGETILPQMTHCTRCRADAVGLLDDDKSRELSGLLSDCASILPLETEAKPYVAVATLEGVLVNQHLGEAEEFQIWEEVHGGFHLREVREAPSKGGGILRWELLADTLKDCRAVLCSAIGETPSQVLEENHILPVVMNGFIRLGLEAVFTNGNVAALRSRRKGLAKGCCSGAGGGCG
jgi:nitrogen fixation protein NifB